MLDTTPTTVPPTDCPSQEAADRNALPGGSLKSIEHGPVDYVLRCTNGIFAGRFLHINRTPQGEVFGSDRRAPEITMYIEQAGVSPKHASILFHDDTQKYVLSDLGSADGTLIGLRWDRPTPICDGHSVVLGEKTIFTCRLGEALSESEAFEQYLKAYDLHHVQSKIVNLFGGDASLYKLSLFKEDVQACVSSTDHNSRLSVLASSLSEEDKFLLFAAIEDAQTFLPVAETSRPLIIQLADGTDITVYWCGANIHLGGNIQRFQLSSTAVAASPNINASSANTPTHTNAHIHTVLEDENKIQSVNGVPVSPHTSSMTELDKHALFVNSSQKSNVSADSTHTPETFTHTQNANAPASSEANGKHIHTRSFINSAECASPGSISRPQRLLPLMATDPYVVKKEKLRIWLHKRHQQPYRKNVMIDNETGLSFTLEFFDGRYQVVPHRMDTAEVEDYRRNTANLDIIKDCWLKLRVGAPHVLHPGDLIRIGKLDFAVLRFNTGVGGAQGFRFTMEDEDLVVQDLGLSQTHQTTFAAVYDGHGGRECALFVRRMLHHVLKQQIVDNYGSLDSTRDVYVAAYDAIYSSFVSTDDRYLSQYQNSQNDQSSTSMTISSSGVPVAVQKNGGGCAAIIALIIGKLIWCANCGDARAVLSRGGIAVQLSDDHKPDRVDEQKRITAAGGSVKQKRVNGRLAVSRAFGDVEYKLSTPSGQPFVIADPEIRFSNLKREDEFLLLACDGLFDVFTSQEAVDFVRTRLCEMPRTEQDPQRVVDELIKEAISTRHSRDNVTAIIIKFKRHLTA